MRACDCACVYLHLVAARLGPVYNKSSPHVYADWCGPTHVADAWLPIDASPHCLPLRVPEQKSKIIFPYKDSIRRTFKREKDYQNKASQPTTQPPNHSAIQITLTKYRVVDCGSISVDGICRRWWWRFMVSYDDFTNFRFRFFLFGFVFVFGHMNWFEMMRWNVTLTNYD